MLTLKRPNRMDKTKESLREVLSYTDRVMRDEALRADLLAAIGHGAELGDRVKNDVDADGITKRLANDKKLRKQVRAVVDDLESAGERLRQRRSHRVRNVILILAGAGAAAAMIPSVRRWFAGGSPEHSGDVMAASVT
jgi:hypothetical protein